MEFRRAGWGWKGMGVSQNRSTSWDTQTLRGTKNIPGDTNLDLPKDTQNESKRTGPSCCLLSAACAHSKANTSCSLLTAKPAKQIEGKNLKPQTPELRKHWGLPHALF